MLKTERQLLHASGIVTPGGTLLGTSRDNGVQQIATSGWCWVIEDWEAHFKRIYRTEPAKYDRLVAAEDAHGELAQHVDALASEAATIVDVGAGTGRLTVRLCRPGNRVHGVDRAPAMLELAKNKLVDCPGEWALSVGDVRRLPIADNWADAAIAGWVYGHLTEWYPSTWETELAAAVAELDRVVKDGGVQVIVDTLGTAVEEPGPPTAALGAYHEELETRGFARSVLRTDYRFSSTDESI
jgi:ubiquinone/menaquinone biosynthesis C-methylase UbiE